MRQFIVAVEILILSVLTLSGCGGRVAPTSGAGGAPAATSTTMLITPSEASWPEPNFAFTFAYGACDVDIIDTFEDTFTQGMLVGPSITIALKLSEEEKATIYRKMLAIDFWSYPTTFSIPVPTEGVVGVVTPAMSYRFKVRNGATTKELQWRDEITEPTSAEADRLRDLIALIRGIVEPYPQVKNLPEPRAGCD